MHFCPKGLCFAVNVSTVKRIDISFYCFLFVTYTVDDEMAIVEGFTKQPLEGIAARKSPFTNNGDIPPGDLTKYCRTLHCIVATKSGVLLG